MLDRDVGREKSHPESGDASSNPTDLVVDLSVLHWRILHVVNACIGGAFPHFPTGSAT